MISKVLVRFQLTPKQESVLHAGKITPDFFQAQDRAFQIRTDCRNVLLKTHQKVGLEIIDLMSRFLLSAYDRLQSWIKMEFIKMEVNYDEIHPLLGQAVQTLHAKQPEALKICFDEIASNESEKFLGLFRAALKIGGSGSNPRPIELHAHDPYRFVGDMLGWIHQAVASERELLFRIFVGEHRYHAGPVTDTSDREQYIRTILSTVFESLRETFKDRIDAIWTSRPAVVMVYRLANLLEFYAQTLARMMGDSASLVEVIRECRADGLTLFYDLLQANAERLLVDVEPAPADLTPHPVVHESMTRLMEIMATYDESLIKKHNDAKKEIAEKSEEGQDGFRPIKEIIDPLYKMCTSSVGKLGRSDMAVYLINCLGVMKGSIAMYDFAQERCAELEERINTHLQTFVLEEAARIAKQCRLADKISVLTYRTSSGPLSEEDGMDEKSLGDAMRAFERALYEVEDMITPNCSKVIDANVRKLARTKIQNSIIDNYTNLYDAIFDKENKYKSPEIIAHYTPEQVKTIMG